MPRLGVVLAVASLVGPGVTVRAQELSKGPSNITPLLLLVQKSVQDELRLTPEQVSRAAEVGTRARGSYQELRKADLGLQERRQKLEELRAQADRVVADILRPNQLARFKQILLQFHGAWGVAEPEWARALNLSEGQQQQIRVLLEDADKESREISQGGLNEEVRKKCVAFRQKTTEKAFAILTAAQRARLKDLQGEPFKGEIRVGRPNQN